MKALLGAIGTAIGGAVHIASGTWLCRTCGKPIEASMPADSWQCAACVRRGKR